MAYIINNTRGNLVATVADGTIDNTTIPVTLVGRGVTQYGGYENENYVYLLENFCNPTAPPNPMQGQLWFDSVNNVLAVRSLANTWVNLASQSYVQSQTVSPAFTGTPTAPTATFGANTTQIATTAFVQAALGGGGTGNTSISGNLVTSGNINSSGAISASGNIISGFNVSAVGNLIAGGLVSAAGNVSSGANLVAVGSVSAGTNISAAGNIAVTGAAVIGNTLSVTGNITTPANITANVIYANSVVTTGSTSAFRLPNLTQTQINAFSPQNGDMVYNTTLGLPQVYQNGQWNNFTISYYS